MAGRPAIGAVFLREARRSSRRWQTYALRFVFAGSLLVLLLVMSSTEGGLSDPAQSSEFGRRLFLVYAYTQMAIAGVLAPLLVGLGVAEEREEGTLQLLVITQLSTFQILWGKVVSRLLILASFIVGSLPVLALIATFGGVGVWEVVNVTVNTLLVCLVLGTIGGVAALFSGGGAIALAVAAVWALLNWLIVPGLYYGLTAASGQPDTSMALLSPPAAMMQTSWRGFAPVFTNVPVVVFVAGLVTPLFSLVTSRSAPDLDAPLTGDPELRHVSRVQRRVGVMALLVPVFTAATLASFLIRHGNRVGNQVGRRFVYTDGLGEPLISRTVVAVRRWAAALVSGDLGIGVTLATAVLIMALSAGVLALAQLRISAVTAQAFGGGTATGVLATVLRRFDAVVRPIRLPVWRDPVVWREVMTRGLGGPAVFARWMLLPLLAGGVFAMCIGAISGDGQVLWTVGMMMWLFTAGLTVLVATTSATTERSAGTLRLLMTTTYSPVRLVIAKTVATLIATGPWAAVSIVLVALGYVPSRNMAWRYDAPYGGAVCTFPTMGESSGLLDALTVGTWLTGAYLLVVTLSLMVGMRARPARLSVGILLGCVVAVMVGGAAFDIIMRFVGIPMGFEDTTSFFQFPSRYNMCSGNWGILGFGLLYAGLSVVPLIVLMARIRTWILHDTPS